MKVKVINKSRYPLPGYETAQSAGMDLRADIGESTVLRPGERKLFPTGIFLEIPEGYEAQVRPRSGRAARKGITVLNAPGTVDADYRGEVGVILVNLGQESIRITPGERIAQMVFARYERAELEETDRLGQTDRGEGGFGHTGNR